MRFDDNRESRTGTACRRGNERYRLLYSGEAFVEFVGPDGRAWKLELLGISSRGLCFGLQGGQPALERGSAIDGVVVRVGSATIGVNLVIAHATEEFAAGTICGAEVYPATEADEQSLKKAIASLGW